MNDELKAVIEYQQKIIDALLSALIEATKRHDAPPVVLPPNDWMKPPFIVTCGGTGNFTVKPSGLSIKFTDGDTK